MNELLTVTKQTAKTNIQIVQSADVCGFRLREISKCRQSQKGIVISREMEYSVYIYEQKGRDR